MQKRLDRNKKKQYTYQSMVLPDFSFVLNLIHHYELSTNIPHFYEQNELFKKKLSSNN